MFALFVAGCSGSTATMPAAAQAPRAGTSARTNSAVPTPSAPAPAAAAALAPPPIAKTAWGKLGNNDVELYTLTNRNGLVLKVATYGATVTELHVPDRNGKLADVVLGFDDLQGYLNGKAFFGATVGRVANRIGGAKFKLEGKEYELAANDGRNHLHGGTKGFDKVVWSGEPLETPEGPAVKLRYVSKDGEEGYPGTVTASVVYTLTQQNELKVLMQASTDKTTLVNLAHHSYWNLGGFASGPITDHELTLFADNYTPVVDSVPTGVIKPVAGTPFDFTKPKIIGKDLMAAGGDPIGYDHNFVVNGEPDRLRPVARVKDPKSGRVMTLEADQPGVQFYSGNFLDAKSKVRGKGVSYVQRSGLCLETQKFPNSINIPAWQDQVILKPGQAYSHTMIHRFSAE